MAKITDRQVIDAAISMGETTHPMDLTLLLKQTYNISLKVAMVAVRRVLILGRLQQEITDRWSQNTGHHASGMYNVKVRFYRWKENHPPNSPEQSGLERK